MIEIRDEHVDEILADAHALAFPRYPGTEGDSGQALIGHTVCFSIFVIGL